MNFYRYKVCSSTFVFFKSGVVNINSIMDVTEISQLVAAVHLEERGEGEEHITTKIRREGGGSFLSLCIYW